MHTAVRGKAVHAVLGVNKEVPVVGKGLDMCPEKEKIRRCKQRQLHVLEVDSAGQVIAVKEFIRAGAGHAVPDPYDLRPASTLLETMHYLIRKVTERRDHPWHLIYEFVHNRLQSIRQDITYQQLDGEHVKPIFQMATRFYLYAQYRLWTCPIDKFEPKLNRDHLQQCLNKLLREKNIEAEFVAYYLLANLGNNEVITHTLQLDTHIRHNPRVQLSLAIGISHLHNNYVRLFRLTGKLLPLEKCALLPHISNVRRQALQTMCSAYGSRNAKFPLQVLCQWLNLEDTKTTEIYCQQHGLEVAEDNVLFRRGALSVPAQAPTNPFTIPNIDNQVRFTPSHFIQSEHVSGEAKTS